MTVAHESIAEAYLHEPKGASTLTGGASDEGKIYISDGAGSGDWRHIPHGAFYYSDIGTGTTIATPTAYTLINPITVGDPDPRDSTTNDSGRLTYTGTHTIDGAVSVAITFKHSTGAGVDCFFSIYANGSPLTGAEFVRTADSGNYGSIALLGHGAFTTNDYVEVYCKCSAGSIIIHSIALEAEGRL